MTKFYLLFFVYTLSASDRQIFSPHIILSENITRFLSVLNQKRDISLDNLNVILDIDNLSKKDVNLLLRLECKLMLFFLERVTEYCDGDVSSVYSFGEELVDDNYKIARMYGILHNLDIYSSSEYISLLKNILDDGGLLLSTIDADNQLYFARNLLKYFLETLLPAVKNQKVGRNSMRLYKHMFQKKIKEFCCCIVPIYYKKISFKKIPDNQLLDDLEYDEVSGKFCLIESIK